MKTTAAIALALIAAAPAAAQQPPAAPPLEFTFEETVELGASVTPGDTARGGRVIIPISGGHFAGPAIKGEVMPGGWDWQLVRADGCREVKADYFLKTDDGVVINVVNTGVICAGQPVRTHPVFEAPRGKYEWLSKNAFVGTLELAEGSTRAIRIRFYQVR